VLVLGDVRRHGRPEEHRPAVGDHLDLEPCLRPGRASRSCPTCGRAGRASTRGSRR
jgi:hypothetical protein